MSDLTDTISEQEGRITDLENNADQAVSDLSDYQDSIDSTLNDQADSISSLNDSAGQLVFPLTQDTIDLINEQFPRGTIQLSGATAVLKDDRISASTIIIHSVMTTSVGTTITVGSPHLNYSYVATTGQATFYSTIGGDSSTLNYLLLL